MIRVLVMMMVVVVVGFRYGEVRVDRMLMPTRAPDKIQIVS